MTPKSDRATAAALILAALVLYAPAIWWGLPHATVADRAFAWGSDELAPLGSVGELYRVFLDRDAVFNMQYPLFHYFVQAVFVVPYLALLAVDGGLTQPSSTYPFGFADPVGALGVTTILSRIPSLLMAAGVVVAAWRSASILWDRRTGVITGVLVLLMYPMIYYARTSNVDMGGLFWTSLGLVVFAAALRDELTVSRGVWLGVFAALATATKDAGYAAFAMLALVLVPRHLMRAWRAGSRWWPTVKPLVGGLVASAGIYVIASGMVFHPGRWVGHYRWVTDTRAAFLYPSTIGGSAQLVAETAAHLVESMGLPTALATLVGLGLAWRRSPLTLALALPAAGIFVGTILPIHFVNFRYVFIMAFVLVFFAGYAFSTGMAARRPRVRAWAAGAFAATVLWAGVRGLDLTHQMLEDSRYALGELLAQITVAGDRVGYYGAPQKLPALAASISSQSVEDLCDPADWASQDAPDFVVIIPQQHFEVVHELSLSPTVYGGLDDGSLGYRRIAYFQTRALSSRRPVSFVNPPVQLFMRTDRSAGGLNPTTWLTPPAPVLAGVEKRLGLEVRKPPGLMRNPTPKNTLNICP